MGGEAHVVEHLYDIRVGAPTDQCGGRILRVHEGNTFSLTLSEIRGFLLDLDGTRPPTPPSLLQSEQSRRATCALNARYRRHVFAAPRAGTMYTPSGMIDGAVDFHAYLREEGIPYVFCSNTGKGASGVQQKLKANGITSDGELVGGEHIFTAAQAQCQYMVDNLPRGAKVFVFAGGNAETADSSFWMEILRELDSELVASWDVHTHLSEGVAKEWGELAACSDSDHAVAVVLFSDGSISSVPDPITGELGFADWSFDVIKKAGYLLSHGAAFICTAEDSFNVRPDGWPLPGPGMISAMFRTLMYPAHSRNIHVCGKGGNRGNAYMMDAAIAKLERQGHSGQRDKIVMVGDRFDTDVRAGVLAGTRTCLVESGCHAIAQQRYYPNDQADFVAKSVADLIVRPGAGHLPLRSRVAGGL